MIKRILPAMLFVLLGVPAWGSGLGLMVGGWDTSEAGQETMLGARLELTAGAHVAIELRGGFLQSLGSTREPVPYELDAFPVDLGVAWHFDRSRQVSPYLGAGISYVALDVRRLEPHRTAQVSSEAGWYGVAGLEVGLRPHWVLFVEGLYRDVKAQLEGGGLDDFDTLGLDLAGGGANLGVGIRW